MDGFAFSKYVAMRRGALHKTQKDLAEALSYTPQAISKFEATNSAFPIDMMPALCDFLECGLDDVFTRNLNPSSRGERPIPLEGLSERLKFYRQKAGVTQNELAERCEASLRATKNYESGVSIPSYQVLERWCAACGTTPTALLRDPLPAPETEKAPVIAEPIEDKPTPIIPTPSIKRRAPFLALSIGAVALAACIATPVAIVYAQQSSRSNQVQNASVSVETSTEGSASSLGDSSLPSSGAEPSSESSSSSHSHIVPSGTQFDNFICDVGAKRTLTIKAVVDTEITELEIPNTLTKDGVDYTVKKINPGALYGCGNLESLTLPFICGQAEIDAETAIQNPFSEIFGQEEFPGSKATRIESYGDAETYYFPANLKELTVNCANIFDGKKIIPSYVFSWLDTLESIRYNEAVDVICGYSFSSCPNLKSVFIPDGETEIQDGVFQGDESLSDFSIPNGTTSIGSLAFYECSFEEIAIPDTVTSLGLGVFYNCNGLKNAVIPDSVVEMGTSTFSGCTSLVSAKLPAHIAEVPICTFMGCTSLYSIEVPSSVTALGESAFNNCFDLTSVHLPEGLETIGKYCFLNCVALPFIELPSTLKTIGDYGFADCMLLEECAIPSSVTYIGEGAFHNNPITEAVIPDGITSVAPMAFFCTRKLTSITLPESITEIGSRAFYGDYSLPSFPLPSKLTSIGEEAFQQCDAFDVVNLPSAMTFLGRRAFYLCASLKEVSIPAGLTDISPEVFELCSSLKKVTFGGTVSEWQQRYIANPNGSWGTTGTYTDETYFLPGSGHTVICADGTYVY